MPFFLSKILFFFFIQMCLAGPFSQTPLVQVTLTAGQATMIAAASDQSMIAVAFPNALMGYNFEGVNTVQFNTSNVG